MNKRSSQIVIAIFVFSLVVLLYFFVGTKRNVETDSGYRVVMGTFARVVAVAPDSKTANSCIKAALLEIENVDALMSDYKSDSEISFVNKFAFERAVKVSEPTYEVLQKSIEMSKLTDGAFDITVGPLVDFLRSVEEKGAALSEEEIAKAKLKVGFEKIELDAQNRTVHFTVDGMQLDLGGIAKGYAIDLAVDTMRKHRAVGGMVDIGGDIRCFGVAPNNGNRWRIGLQDPNEPVDEFGTREPLLVLKLTERAIATSGGYRRFALIDGKKYSHIINPTTGTSAEGLASVTIIAEKAIDADALATAVSVMGTEKGLVLIEKLPNTEALLMPSQFLHQIIKTSGAEKFVR